MYFYFFSILSFVIDFCEKLSSEVFCLSEKFGKIVILVKKSLLDELKVLKVKKFILKGSLMINWNLRIVGGWLSFIEKNFCREDMGIFIFFVLVFKLSFVIIGF